MTENPIFIVGTERSGSNLLRLLLNELPNVTIPHPPHLLRDLAPLVHRYGDLALDRNFRSLVADAAKLVRLHFAPWPFAIDEHKVLSSAPRSLYGVYAAFYEQYRLASGKPRWGCKSTFMIHQVEEVLRHHLAPRFLHLVRDPRDVAVSARDSVFNHFHPFYVAGLWRDEQQIGLDWAALHPTQWLTIRYEDLLAAPEATLQGVCSFLGEPYSPDLLRYFEREPARNLATLSGSWQNLSQPILRNNREKYLTELSAKEIALIESIAGRQMKAFGYELRSTGSPSPPSVARRAAYFASEKIQQWRMEFRSLALDANAHARLKKRLFLRYLACPLVGRNF